MADRRHVPELDGIRGVAIAAVLSYHFWLDGSSSDASWFQAGSIGWAGVDLFFVLSGFLLGGQVLDAGDAFSRRAFWTRRAARILPLYLVLVASWLAMRAFGPDALRAPIGSMPAWVALTLTQNLYEGFHFGLMMQWIGPTWSLAIEEHFYLLVALAMPWAMRHRLVRQVCVGCIAFAFVFRLAVGVWGGSTSAYFLTPSRIDGPAAGVLLAWLVRNTSVLTWRLWAPRAVLAFSILAAFQAHFGRMMLAGNSAVYVVTAAGSMSLIAAALQGGWTARIMRATPLRWLGDRAYGLYLVHFPALFVVEFAAGKVGTSHPWAVPVIALLLTLAIAEISLRYIERPAIRLGARIASRSSARIRPSPA